MDSATLSLIVTILSVREIVFSKKTWKHTRTCTRHSGHFLALSRVDFETQLFRLPVLRVYQYGAVGSPENWNHKIRDDDNTDKESFCTIPNNQLQISFYGEENSHQSVLHHNYRVICDIINPI